MNSAGLLTQFTETNTKNGIMCYKKKCTLSVHDNNSPVIEGINYSRYSLKMRLLAGAKCFASEPVFKDISNSRH